MILCVKQLNDFELALEICKASFDETGDKNVWFNLFVQLIEAGDNKEAT